MIVVGQGLAGTLYALEAERGGSDVVVIDLGSGRTASRAAAGLLNPLTGPRFTNAPGSWFRLVSFYRECEQRLGVSLWHPLVLVRPLRGTFRKPEYFPIDGPGWKAIVESRDSEPHVCIFGGGWVDVETLLDAARERWLARGRLEERWYSADEAHHKTTLWCEGWLGLTSEKWQSATKERSAIQAVRGDVLTVVIPGHRSDEARIGSRFLIPLGNDVFRWGATHEWDIDDQSYRSQARAQLERELESHLQGKSYSVRDHRWGVRPASRSGRPLVAVHHDRPEWTLFNGFGGRGLTQIPEALDQLLH